MFTHWQEPAILAGLLAALLAATVHAAPLGTAFTYQGQLKESGLPASGLYDLQACLFDDPATPAPIACAPDFDDVPVDAGLFTITLDFGSLPFAGEARFLELRVRPGASGGGYTILSPRQPIRPAPEALRAAASSTAPWSGLSGVPAGFADGVDDDTNSGGTVTSVATGTGLTGGPITGTGTVAIATGGVGSAQLADGGVLAIDVASDSLGRAQIAANAIEASELANNSVDTASIVDGNVTSAKIAAGAVGASQIAPGAVGTSQLAVGAVGAAQINPAQVQARVGGSCAPGTYLRGINSDGSVLCAEVSGVTAITTVDDQANFVGQDTSIAIGSDGLPVISYHDVTAGALKVAKCANAACTGTATITTVDDSANDVGNFTSLAIGIDGLPVISYFDNTAFTLKVAKCANTACTGAATITTVDDPVVNRVGFFTSLAIGIDGLPVISYRDFDARALKVAKCANAACTGVSTITTVDDPANEVGAFTSIAIGSDGLPVIAYFDDTADALKVAKCVNAACTGTATITTVDDPVNSVGIHVSLAVGGDGLPVISYLDQTAATLKVAKCANAACTGIATITPIDVQASITAITSIDIGSDGLPVIAYFDQTASALKVARCANAACTGAATITIVDDPANNVGQHSSIAIGSDGLPVISYRDATASSLKVAKCGSRSCR